LVAIAAKHDGIISVYSGQNLIVVSLTGEFPLGQVNHNDQIVREYHGDRLVGVRLVKDVDAR
jgi:hypothetical protein